jgi:hypothetical protein
MAREVSSITRVGTSEPFELQVSRGQIAYHEFIHTKQFGLKADFMFIPLQPLPCIFLAVPQRTQRLEPALEQPRFMDWTLILSR